MKNCIACVVTLVSLLALGGCESQPQHEFGSSVDEMIVSQTYNPEAVNNPAKGVVGGMDGTAAEQIITTYRGSGAKETPVDRNIGFELEAK